MKQDSSILKEDSRRKKINEYQIKFNVLVKKKIIKPGLRMLISMSIDVESSKLLGEKLLFDASENHFAS